MRILLADHHPIIRDGLRYLLQREGFVHVGAAATGRDVIARTTELIPDVVITAIAMPDINGIDATRRIVSEHPNIKVVALSMHSDRRTVNAMLAAGAVGYVVKSSPSKELIQAIRAVARDNIFVSPSIAGAIVDNASKARQGSVRRRTLLTRRECEVLQLVAEGHSSKGIATGLMLAVPTIETHRRQIMTKLNIRTVAELTKYAVREGLTPLDR